MKKTALLLSLVLFSTVMVACEKKDTVVQTQTDTVVTECQKEVNNYLNSANKKWKWESIKQWDNIVVDYIWRLADGTVFDTSVQSVAQACGKYSEARDYTQWLSFEAMWWQMVKWFDEAVIWMKVWQTKTVEFWPEKWYWEYEETLVIKAPIEEVWDVSQLSEWDTVYVWMGYPAKILKITSKDVTFDLNHELAWKDLIFDITVKSIN